MSPRQLKTRLQKARAEARRRFLYDLLERTGATFLEGFLGVVSADGIISRIDLSLREQLFVGAVTGGFAVLKCLAATLRGAADSASLLPANVDPPQGDAGHGDTGTLATLAVAVTIGVFLGGLILHLVLT